MVVVDFRGRPLEQAQVLWQRALELAGPLGEHGSLAEVTEVLEAARHDSTTLAHALALGRTQLRGEANILGIDQAVHTLERAVEFLGVRPSAHAAAMDRPRYGA